jgi:SAM-dependent methyltransferase
MEKKIGATAAALESDNFPKLHKQYFIKEGNLVKRYAHGVLLDVGCGNCRLLPFVYAASDRYIGIDSDKKIVAEQKKILRKKYPKAMCILGDAKKLGYYIKPKSADVSVCLWNTLHCIGEESQVLKQMLATTKDIVIVTLVAKGAKSFNARLKYYRKFGIDFKVDKEKQTFFSDVWGESKAHTVQDIEELAKKTGACLIKKGKLGSLGVYGIFKDSLNKPST